MKKLIADLREGKRWIQTSAFFLGVLFLISADPLWKIYADILDLGPGGIGSEAQDDTPVAHSVADMENLEKFTILEPRLDYTDEEHVWLGDVLYYIVTLDSGERVAVTSNYENASLLYQDGMEGYLYRYAVGEWKLWELDQQALAEARQISPALTSTDYYADMSGHHLTALSEEKFKDRCFTLCQVCALIFLMAYGGYRLQKLERREKKKQETSLPQNDLERWIAGTYAIWGQFFAQVASAEGKMAWDDELEKGPIHFGGRPLDEASQKLTRETLLDSWDIKNQRELLETVDYMSTGPGFQNCRDQASRAWELCRSMQLLGMSFIAGWCGREEMLRRSCKVGKIVQNTFSSWEELCESFIEGYARWQFRSYPELAPKTVQIRRDIYEGLRQRQDSPYYINWYLPLDLDEWKKREKHRKDVERRLG